MKIKLISCYSRFYLKTVNIIL